MLFGGKYCLSLTVYQTAIVTPKSDYFLTGSFSTFKNSAVRFP